MKKLAVLALSGSLLVASSACADLRNLNTKENIDRLKEAKVVACFIANAFLPNEQMIAQVCSVDFGTYADLISKTVGEHKKGVARELEKAGVQRCPPGTDAGAAPAPKRTP